MCLPAIQEDVSDDGEKDLMANIDGFVRDPHASFFMGSPPCRRGGLLVSCHVSSV
jgi:hypothetical protein